MAGIAVQLADEVAERINGKTVGSETLSCVRKLIVDLKLASARTLNVIAVPHSLESKIIDRGIGKSQTVLVDVGVMRRANENELENLLELTQGIGDLLEGFRFSRGRCIRVAYAPLYDSEIWLQQHCFFAVIVAEIKVI